MTETVQSVPRVAIVGRPNVGKSSLLNMLAGRLVSIVDATAGVTRDRVSIEVDLPPSAKGGPPRRVEVMDTGGYGVYSGDEDLGLLTEVIEKQIDFALAEAHLVLFVVDAQDGVTPLDEQVAQLLRKRVKDKRPVVLIANKVDNDSLELNIYEFARLGFGEPVPISAATTRNKWELMEMLDNNIDWEADYPPARTSEMLLAVVGKRNAGKSTFINALAGAERVIASELAGTTRDSVDVKVTVRLEDDEHTFTTIDTAGLRKRKSFADDIEYYATHRALRSVRRADVCLFMLDATSDVSQVDKKLSGIIQKHHKPTVLVVNKWDLVEGKVDPEDYIEYLTDALRGFDYAPIVYTSAKNNDHVLEAVRIALELHRQASVRVTTGELNTHLREILEQRGPSTKLGRKIKIYYVTQVATNPPTIVMFVNDADAFDNSYQRYMINELRERLPFKEVPIKLAIRNRQRRTSPDEPVAEI